MNGLLGTTCYDSIVSALVVLGDSNVERRIARPSVINYLQPKPAASHPARFDCE